MSDPAVAHMRLELKLQEAESHAGVALRKYNEHSHMIDKTKDHGMQPSVSDLAIQGELDRDYQRALRAVGKAKEAIRLHDAQMEYEEKFWPEVHGMDFSEHVPKGDA